MTRDEVERAAKEFVQNYNQLKSPLGSWCMLDFAIKMANRMNSDCAKIVKTQALARKCPPALRARRKNQPSISSIELAKAIRALKIK